MKTELAGCDGSRTSVQRGLVMKKKRYGILLFLCVALFPVSAQEKPIISVLDFSVDSVSESEMTSIINVLSSELFKSGYFTVIDVSQRERILKEMEFSVSGCSDESCQLEIGKMLSAEGIVVGSIGKVGTRYVLSVKLLKTETGEALSTADGIYTDLDELLDGIGTVAMDLGAPYGGEPEPETVEAPAPEPEAEKGSRNPGGWVTLAGGVGCLGAGGYFLAVSLPLLINYMNAVKAYDDVTDPAEALVLYDDVEESRQAALDGNVNNNVLIGGGLTAAGIGLGAVSAILFSKGRKQDDGKDLAAAILPVPGGAVLNFHVRY